MNTKRMIRAFAGTIVGAILGLLITPVLSWMDLALPGSPKWGPIVGFSGLGFFVGWLGWRKASILVDEEQNSDKCNSA